MRTIIYKGPPKDVEGFPGGAERSCVGALHLSPGSSRDVTEDELAFLEANKVRLGFNIVDITPKPAVEPKKAEVAPKPPSAKKGEGPKEG